MLTLYLRTILFSARIRCNFYCLRSIDRSSLALYISALIVVISGISIIPLADATTMSIVRPTSSLSIYRESSLTIGYTDTSSIS